VWVFCYTRQTSVSFGDGLRDDAASRNPENVSFRCCGRLLHRHVSAMDVGAVKAPRFGGAKSCKRLRQSVWISRSRFSDPRRRCGGECYRTSSAQAAVRVGILPEAAAVPDRHRSLRLVASLVARAPRVWPHCAPDAAGLCEAHVKRYKNDAVDAEANCEAVTRANMRFVATKTPEQQSCLTLHRTRHLSIRQQTRSGGLLEKKPVGIAVGIEDLTALKCGA
jgi:hypothetical protein